MGTVVAIEDIPLQLFEICLNRDEYFPGEVVTGKLLLVTSRALKTEGIFIKFEGKGSVRWKNQSAHLCGLKEAEFVHEKRKYFSNIFRYDFDTLPEGCSVLTFEFELPTGIPQSIEPETIMKQLKISYSLEALIRTQTEDYRQQQSFTVKGIFNLNSLPELSHPACKTVREAVFESCWSSSGRLKVLSFSIKKQGFVPGEQIKAELLLKDGDNCKTPVLGVEVHLIQEIDLQIRTASRIRRRIVSKSDMVHVVSSAPSNIQTKKRGDNNTRRSHQRKLNFYLTIPDDILISYGNTDKHVHDFISIRYFLRMTMEQTSFPYKPLQMQLPIKIGTVFLKEQKNAAPILLLAPVPSALPRPLVPQERRSSSCKLGIDCRQPGKSHSTNYNSDALPTPPTNLDSLPQICLNSNKQLAIMEQPVSSSPSPRSNVSPRTPKRKPGNANTVIGDSSSFLCKPFEAFGGDDSSDSSFLIEQAHNKLK